MAINEQKNKEGVGVLKSLAPFADKLRRAAAINTQEPPRLREEIVQKLHAAGVPTLEPDVSRPAPPLPLAKRIANFFLPKSLEFKREPLPARAIREQQVFLEKQKRRVPELRIPFAKKATPHIRFTSPQLEKVINLKYSRVPVLEQVGTLAEKTLNAAALVGDLMLRTPEFAVRGATSLLSDFGFALENAKRLAHGKDISFAAGRQKIPFGLTREQVGLEGTGDTIPSFWEEAVKKKQELMQHGYNDAAASFLAVGSVMPKRLLDEIIAGDVLMAALRRAPESLLTKIKTETLPIETKDLETMLFRRKGALEKLTPGERNAQKFISKLTNEEQKALRQVLEAARQEGQRFIQIANKEASKLGELAGFAPTGTAEPVQPRKQLPGFKPAEGEPRFAPGLRIQKVERVGEGTKQEIASFRKKFDITYKPEAINTNKWREIQKKNTQAFLAQSKIAKQFKTPEEFVDYNIKKIISNDRGLLERVKEYANKAAVMRVLQKEIGKDAVFSKKDIEKLRALTDEDIKLAEKFGREAIKKLEKKIGMGAVKHPLYQFSNAELDAIKRFGVKNLIKKLEDIFSRNISPIKNPALEYFKSRTVPSEIVLRDWDEKEITPNRVSRAMILSVGRNFADGFSGLLIKKQPYSDVYLVNIKDGKRGGVFYKVYYGFPTKKQVLYDAILGDILPSYLSIGDLYPEISGKRSVQKSGSEGGRVQERAKSTDEIEKIKNLQLYEKPAKIGGAQGRAKAPPEGGGIPGIPGLRKVGLAPEAPRKITKLETTLLKEKIRTLARGMREGAKLAKDQIAEKQKLAIEVINGLGLAPSDKAKFLKKITNKQLFGEKFPDILKEIRDRAEKLAEKQRKREAVAYLKKTLRAVRKASLRTEYEEKINEILGNIDLEHSERARLKLGKVRDYLRDNPDTFLPPELIDELGALEKKSIGEMTPDEVEFVADAIQHYLHLNKLKNKLIFGNILKDFYEFRDKLLERVRTKKPKAPLAGNEIVSLPEIKPASALRKIFGVDSLAPRDLGEFLDRDPRTYGLYDVIRAVREGKKEIRLPGTEAFYIQFYDATRKQIQFQQKISNILRRVADEVGITSEPEKWSRYLTTKPKKVPTQEFVLESGAKLKITRGEKIGLVLTAERPSSRELLLREGFSFRENLHRVIKITENDLEKIAASLTREEQKVRDAIRQTYKEGADAINATSRRINGTDIAKEDEYHPRKRNPLTLRRNALTKNEKLTPETMRGFYSQTIEGMGILKEATMARGALLIEDAFKVAAEHAHKVSAYYGFAEPLRNAKALLYDPTFAREIVMRYGKHYLDALKRFVADIEEMSPKTDAFTGLISRIVLRNIPKAIFRFNPFIWFKQPVSYLLYNIDIPAKYLAKAAASDTKQAMEEMMKYSPLLRDRIEGGSMMREVSEAVGAGGVLQLWTGKALGELKGIKKFDLAAVARGWNAVKAYVRDTHPELKGKEYWDVVARYAEYLTSKTQPTAYLVDRSAIGRSRNLMLRTLTMFTNIRNKMYRLIASEIHRFSVSAKKTKDVWRLLKNMTLIAAVSSMMIELINTARRKLIKKEGTSPGKFLVSSVGNTIGLSYFAGDIVQSLASKIERGTFAGWDYSNPVSQFVDNAINALANSYRAIAQAVNGEKYRNGKEKWVKSAQKAINEAMDTVGKLTGVPYRNLRDLIGVGISIIAGEEEKNTQKETAAAGTRKKLFGRSSARGLFHRHRKHLFK